jgi:hypothetical protein
VRKTKTASPSIQRSAHLRRLSITLLGALALSACSPSIPQGAQWTDDPFRTDSTSSAQGSTASATKNRATTGNTDGIPRGSGTLRIAYAPGWQLPADYVSAFVAASGYTVEQSEYAPNSSQNADVIFGVDSKQAAALGTVIPVGNDPICAWADRSWFSANSKALPSSLKDLSSANFAPLTAIPSQDSEAGAAFAAKASSVLGGDYEDWKENLNDAHSISSSAAEALGQWTATLADDRLSLISGATSAQGSHQRPILIWDARLAVAAASNTGTESRAEAIPGTCVDSTISVAVPQSSSNSEAVRSFQAFLESQLGKNAAAYAGLAYNDGVPEDSQAAWFMKPVK